VTDSAENVENVVKPPKNPVVINGDYDDVESAIKKVIKEVRKRGSSISINSG
jgi:effector-binding domain-containing protein